MADFAQRGVYAIYDHSAQSASRAVLIRQVAALLDGGVVRLQYRNKHPGTVDRRTVAELAACCRSYNAAFIINDDWQLAEAVGADGVHLGQSDGDPAKARAALGADALIGVSCQDRLDRARQALADGADHVSFGRFFASTTKPDAPPASPDVLGKARALGAPVVAIGGIDATNAAVLIEAGADLIAVSGALFHAKHPRQAAARLAGLFERKA